jgi:hypothetical protein
MDGEVDKSLCFHFCTLYVPIMYEAEWTPETDWTSRGTEKFLPHHEPNLGLLARSE